MNDFCGKMTLQGAMHVIYIVYMDSFCVQNKQMIIAGKESVWEQWIEF
jgi:hypothetical protein